MQAIAIPTLPLTALLLAGLSLPTSLHGQAERYSLASDNVAIYNLAGEVKIESGPGPDVVAEVTRGGADAGKLKIFKGELDGREALRLVYPGDRIKYGKLSDGSSTQLRVRDNGTFGGDDDEEDRKREGRRVTIEGRGGGPEVHADLRITVPNGRTLELYLAVGKVAVSNVQGDLVIDAASAPVSTSNTRGELDIEVGSGTVQVTQARGDLEVNTGSGSVGVSDVRGKSVSIDTGSGEVTATDLRSGDLSINTGSGDIQVTGLTAPEVSLRTGSGAVTADLSGDVWEVDVQTGSGDITLKAPPTLSAEVDIETSSGDIETDFPVQVTRHARDHMTGRIGDGQGKIDIETGSGGIKLVRK